VREHRRSRALLATLPAKTYTKMCAMRTYEALRVFGLVGNPISLWNNT